MKFIHSFWSKPFVQEAAGDNWNLRYHGGFPNEFLFYCAWCYSCLSIKRFYPNLHLVTDKKGLNMFRDILQLPYVSFSTDLEKIEPYDPGLWALGKLYTYQIQDEPFCHLDGDVFLFGPVLDDMIQGRVFCQGFDSDVGQYAEIHPYIHENFDKVPKEYHADLSKGMNLINAGVIGGNDLDIFQRYTCKAFELIEANSDKLVDINVGLFNLYYEQFLFSNMVTMENIDVRTLFSIENGQPNFAAFHEIPMRSQYVHLISHLKRSTEFMEQLVVRLSTEFPEYYEKLLDYFKVEVV